MATYFDCIGHLRPNTNYESKNILQIPKLLGQIEILQMLG